MLGNTFEEAEDGSVVIKRGDTTTHSQLDPRATMQAKHSREILAKG